MMASPASKRAVVVLLVVVASVMATPSEAMRPRRKAALVSSETRAFRFPGFPGSRQRFPGFPGARTSPRAAAPKPSPPSSSVPGLPLSPPAAAGGSLPPPCGRSAQTTPPGTYIPGLPGSGAGSSSSSPTDCVTSLAGLTTCASFLTGAEAETPTPTSECCGGLGMFLNSTAAAEGDRTLRCLCPVILGDVNRMLPKPVDPVRMMYLPIACGLVLPPQVLFICFTGQPNPPVLTRVPDSWSTLSSALSP